MSEVLQDVANMVNNQGWCRGNEDAFPCGEEAIVLVSMGLAAAGLGLIMVAFLMHQVRSPANWSGICPRDKSSFQPQELVLP